MVFSFFIAWLRQAQPPCYIITLVISAPLNHRVTPDAWAQTEGLRTKYTKAPSYSSLWFRLRSITVLYYYYSRCLSLSKAHSYSHPCDFYSAQSPCYSRCLSLSKAEVHFFIWWFRLRSITFLYLFLLSVPEPVEGTFSLILPVISAPLNHRVTFGAWACRRHIFQSLSV